MTRSLQPEHQKLAESAYQIEGQAEDFQYVRSAPNLMAAQTRYEELKHIGYRYSAEELYVPASAAAARSGPALVVGVCATRELLPRFGFDLLSAAFPDRLVVADVLRPNCMKRERQHATGQRRCTRRELRLSSRGHSSRGPQDQPIAVKHRAPRAEGSPIAPSGSETVWTVAAVFKFDDAFAEVHRSTSRADRNTLRGLAASEHQIGHRSWADLQVA